MFLCVTLRIFFILLTETRKLEKPLPPHAHPRLKAPNEMVSITKLFSEDTALLVGALLT